MSWIENSGASDLPAIFQVLAIDPDALDMVKDLNETISFGNSALGRVREEAIATVVAVANRCRFGALTHGGFLRQYSGDPETTAKMLVNYNTANLDFADRSMLDFAVRATTNPSSLTRHDVENLQRAGFDDHEVLSIVLITCLVNFMNRLADCLGVDVPPGYQKAMESWLTGPAARQPWLMRPVDLKTSDVKEVQPSLPDVDSSGPAGEPQGNNEPGPHALGGNNFEEYPGATPNGHNSGMDDGSLDAMWPGSGPIEEKRFSETAESSVEIAGSQPPELEKGSEAPGMLSREALRDIEATIQDTEPVLDLGVRDLLGQAGPGNPAFGNQINQPAAAGETQELPEDPSKPVDETAAATTTALEDMETQTDRPADLEEEIPSLDPNHSVAKFVNENCRVHDGEVTGSKELYIFYLRWCDETGAPPLLQRSFGMALNRMGFNRRRRGRSRNWSWWGLSLANGSQDDDEGDDFDTETTRDPDLEDELD